MSRIIRDTAELRGISLAELARLTGQKPQNLTNKLRRDNFTEQELMLIADALNCELVCTLRPKDTEGQI